MSASYTMMLKNNMQHHLMTLSILSLFSCDNENFLTAIGPFECYILSYMIYWQQICSCHESSWKTADLTLNQSTLSLIIFRRNKEDWSQLQNKMVHLWYINLLCNETGFMVLILFHQIMTSYDHFLNFNLKFSYTMHSY